MSHSYCLFICVMLFFALLDNYAFVPIILIKMTFSDTEKAYSFGQTDPSTKATGKTTADMAAVFFTWQMVYGMMDFGTKMHSTEGVT